MTNNYEHYIDQGLLTCVVIVDMGEHGIKEKQFKDKESAMRYFDLMSANYDAMFFNWPVNHIAMSL